MGPSSPNRRLGAAAALPLLALAGCAEINTVADVVFPSSVPGLPSGEAWTSLPIRRWLTDERRGIDPVAVSVCFTPACAEPAVAALFRARGAEADALRKAALDPRTLLASLRQRPFRHTRRDRPNVGVTVRQVEEAGRPGLLVEMARANGTQPAAGFAATVEQGGSTQVLLIVAPSEAAARRIARSVLPRLGR